MFNYGCSVTVTVALLLCIPHILCTRNLVSEIPANKLAKNFHAYIYDIHTQSQNINLKHVKWEQYFELSDGQTAEVDWIFHSSKSMQSRISSLACEVVTWVIKVDNKPLGQATCQWSMARANHCNHVCQLPLLPSYKYVDYIDLLSVIDEKVSVFSYVISYSTDSSSDIHSNASYATAGGDEANRDTRQLRTYSDSDEWNTLSSNKLTSFAGIENENFGSSVSISGDFMAVGAIGTKDYEGRVFIYQRLGVTIWKQEYFALIGNEDYSNDFFGWSVSLSGDAVAVGAYQTMHAQENMRSSVGAVYIYLRVRPLYVCLCVSVSSLCVFMRVCLWM